MNSKVVEFLETREEEICIDVRASESRSVRLRDDRRSGARVFLDGFMGLASVRGACNLDDLKTCAEVSLALGMPAGYDLPASGEARFDDGAPPPPAPVEAHEMVSRLLSRVRDDRFIISNHFKFKKTRVRLRNSLGTDLSLVRNVWTCELFFKHAASTSIMDGALAWNGRGIPDMSLLEEQIRLVFDSYVRPVELPKQADDKVLVIFPHPGEIFFDKIAEELTGRNYHEGATLLSGKLGQKVFSDQITIVDHATPSRGAGFMPFDLEGTLRHDPAFNLIDQGIMSALAYDLKSASEFGTCPTGNGFRGTETNSFTGFNTLLLEPGKKTIAELTAEVPAVMPYLISGGEFLDDGSYSTPVQLGFLVEKGRIVGRLPQFGLSTSLTDALGSDFIAVSSDPLGPFDTNPAIFARCRIMTG